MDEASHRRYIDKGDYKHSSIAFELYFACWNKR